MSYLDFDKLIHTAEGRLVMEVLQGRRLPLFIALQDSGEAIFWYPPLVIEGLLSDNERLLEWIRLLEEHITQLRAGAVKQ